MLNGNSECTNDYKIGVIRAYIHRALKVCSTWEQMHTELTYIRQMVVNNGYSNAEFDRVCGDIIEKHLVERAATQDENSTIKLYYENIFTSSYKKDESVMRHIIEQIANPGITKT